MSKKVFEIAKDLEMGAIDLVEKLKSIGLNIRNHMVTLSDEEYALCLKEFGPKSDVESSTKTKTTVTKKKAVSKKTASSTTETKKVVKVVRKKDENQAVPENEDSADLKETVETQSHQTPIVQGESIKSSDNLVSSKILSEKEDDNVHIDSKSESSSVKFDSSSNGILEKENEKEKSEKTEQKTVLLKRKAGDNTSRTTRTSAFAQEMNSQLGENDDLDSELFKEKMHSFTPIFVPDKPKAKVKETSSSALKPGKTAIDSDDDKLSITGLSTFKRVKNLDDDLDDEELASRDAKKRMGDLAAMVSKKAQVKPKDITLLRSEEELKFASSIIGQQIYTPIKKKKVYLGETKKTQITEVKDNKRVVNIHGIVTAKDLADKLSQKFESFQNNVLKLNLLVKPDDYIGLILANEIASLYSYRVQNVAFDEETMIAKEVVKDDRSHLPPRTPIVTVMGHVDHGKTTLIDCIRRTKVTENEAGGITQHIGAYTVGAGAKMITFLDTPGHAAFGSMRQRGANLTDIVILVVAADDGVMPQTRESIKYAQTAGCPIIVAINKMDKESANPERIKQELTEFSLVSEDWGGDTMFVPISALKNEGIDKLLESVSLQAEIMDLREDNKSDARGVIIEAKIETGRGPVATVIVNKGLLRKGDAVVVGECSGRARSLTDFTGKPIESAGPSMPVQILGLDAVPSPGDEVVVVKNEREAKKIAENRTLERKKLEGIEKPKVASLEDFFAEAKVENEKKTLHLVIRSDVQGSYEAIKQALEALGNDEVRLDILSGGVGAITDNDVNLAANAKGIIVGFNMRPVTSARRLAEEKGVEIRTYSIIYDLINDMNLALEGMLEPETVERYIGRAEVRNTFNIPKVGVIGGCAVIDGKIERGCQIRLLRQGKILHDGKLSTLKRFKDEVKEVANGYECGMALESFTDIRVDDIFEAYMIDKKHRKLETDHSH